MPSLPEKIKETVALRPGLLQLLLLLTIAHKHGEWIATLRARNIRTVAAVEPIAVHIRLGVVAHAVVVVQVGRPVLWHRVVAVRRVVGVGGVAEVVRLVRIVALLVVVLGQELGALLLHAVAGIVSRGLFLAG